MRLISRPGNLSMICSHIAFALVSMSGKIATYQQNVDDGITQSTQCELRVKTYFRMPEMLSSTPPHQALPALLEHRASIESGKQVDSMVQAH